MVSTGTMASARRSIDRDDGVRIGQAHGRRRDVWALLIVAGGLVAGLLVLRSGEPPAPAATMPPPAVRVPVQVAPPGVAGASPTASAPGVATSMPIPKTRGARLRALRSLGVAPTRGPDGKPRLDAAPVIDALNEAGVHDGIAAFPPPGTDPPKSGVIVPDDFELPEGYVRHFQTTDDGEPLPPILMFHPDYEFVDEQGMPIAIPPDRVVPPELVPPGFPVRMLEVPVRGGSR
jgi:hypothetical protein